MTRVPSQNASPLSPGQPHPQSQASPLHKGLKRGPAQGLCSQQGWAWTRNPGLGSRAGRARGPLSAAHTSPVQCTTSSLETCSLGNFSLNCASSATWGAQDGGAGSRGQRNACDAPRARQDQPRGGVLHGPGNPLRQAEGAQWARLAPGAIPGLISTRRHPRLPYLQGAGVLPLTSRQRTGSRCCWFLGQMEHRPTQVPG